MRQRLQTRFRGSFLVLAIRNEATFADTFPRVPSFLVLAMKNEATFAGTFPRVNS